jgi:hypothetical protein
LNKKIIGIFISMLLIIIAYPTTGVNNNELKKENDIFITNKLDILDQFQTIFDSSEDLPIPIGKFPLYNYSIQAAQSFKPSKNMLTKVQILVGRNDSANYPFELSIREDLTGNNLVEKIINPPAFVIEDYSWVEFDFEDIFVNIGNTYYIVCKTINSSGNWYLWAAHNDSLSYPNGCAWVSTDEGNTWTNESYSNNNNYIKSIYNNLLFLGNTWDTCFKTYGRDNQPPNTPNINGPSSGKIGNEYDYTFITIDPDGDDVYYLVDWGDGSVDEWIGPFESDELAIISHTWEEQGDYLIRTRARDSHGILSDWASLSISMPKSKTENLIQLNILQPNNGILYIQDTPIPILPYGTIIIGKLTIVASAVSLQIIDKIEFYIDDELKHTENNRFSWLFTPWIWDEPMFFKHRIKVIAYDKGENIASDEIEVWKFF